ncbi:MAG TPA: hypothetical protein VGE07_23325, partial [Herpetosiphonaceae bacterium]
MQRRLKNSFVIALTGIFILTGIPRGNEQRASAQSKLNQCANVTLSGILPQPKDPLKAAFQIVTLNSDCIIQEGPIEYINKSDIQIENDSTPNTQTGDILSNGEINSDHVGQGAFLREIYARSEIIDPIGIKLTALYTKNKWAGNGAQVTGYQISPWSSWHQDGAGLGWK